MREFVLGAARLGEAAERWLRGEVVPSEPALASTVMLVRPARTRSGLEVFLQRRVATMAFAPSVVVFPGGRVDPRDGQEEVAWAGRSPSAWAEVLGLDEPSARLLVTAAVRELFEESGVLLAGPDAESVLPDVSSPVWHERRMELTRHERSLAEVLAEDGLVLRADLLGYRAHWVTPEFEARRYDTRFFAARLPEGQVPDDGTTEVDHADWADPAEVLDALAEGSVLVYPPTQVCLEELAAAGSSDAVVRDASDIARVTPVLTRSDSGVPVLRTELPARP